MEGPTPQLATKRSLVPGVFLFSLVPGARWYPALKPRQYFCMWYIIPHTKTKIIAHVHQAHGTRAHADGFFFWDVSIRNSLRSNKVQAPTLLRIIYLVHVVFRFNPRPRCYSSSRCCSLMPRNLITSCEACSECQVAHLRHEKQHQGTINNYCWCSY